METIDFTEKKEPSPLAALPMQSKLFDPDDFLPEGAPSCWDGESLLHCYRREEGFNQDQCPKCQGPFEYKSVGVVFFVKQGNIWPGPSPAHICNDCSVVVIDETFPQRLAYLQESEYIAPLAIFSLRRPVPDFDEIQWFKTLDGEKIVYQIGEDDAFKYALEKRKRKEKRKASRMARKKNRKK